MADAPDKRRIPFVASNQVSSSTVGTTLQTFYDGGILVDVPTERTVRFGVSFARVYPTGLLPVAARAQFDNVGMMTLVEVISSATGFGGVAALDVPEDWVTLPVELYYNDLLVGKFSLKTSRLSENTVRLAIARAGSDYFWTEQYKFALWEPYSAVAQINVVTGRPTKITLAVRPSTYEKAQLALATYLALGGTQQKA